MPFNERILTIVMSCKGGIQEPHLSAIEKVCEQVHATDTVELSIGISGSSAQVKNRLRRLNLNGDVVTLIEAKNSYSQFQLQRALLVNARTPYTLFLDASTTVQPEMIQWLIEFISVNNPITYSIERVEDDLIATPGALLVCTTLARQIDREYFTSDTEKENMTVMLRKKLQQIGAVRLEWGCPISTLISNEVQEHRSE